MSDRLQLDELTSDQLDTLYDRAEHAEDAIAQVRRLCDLTISASVRVQAVQQARDTLAILDQQQPRRPSRDRIPL